MTDTRALAQELRSKVINEPGSERRAVSLRASCALQMMSDRNFHRVPERIKADCAAALRDCERAWAEHGAQMEG